MPTNCLMGIIVSNLSELSGACPYYSPQQYTFHVGSYADTSERSTSLIINISIKSYTRKSESTRACVAARGLLYASSPRTASSWTR